ncbi:unnamed protein product [Closterium sp. NIES-64]|nr:unnamed protein product [Closterium sp. NIES-64]
MQPRRLPAGPATDLRPRHLPAAPPPNSGPATYPRPRHLPVRPQRLPAAPPPTYGPATYLRPRHLPAAPPPTSGPATYLRPRLLSAAPPNRPAAEPPSSRAAQPPSRPAAEPPSSRAAQQPSRPAAEPPSRRVAQQLSRPAAEPPSCRAAESPCSRAARATLSNGLSLFDLTSGASPAPAVDADATVRSQWATRDAAARLAVRCHLPTSECAHFSQYKSAHNLYDAVVARYSSPATAALSRLMLPYLFPDLAAFPIVADLITHLRTSDTRYRAAHPAEDHFLSVCPTTLTVDLLEKALLAAEKSIVAVGASRGDPRTPIFEGCSPSPLLPFVASAAAADLVGLESVGRA